MECYQPNRCWRVCTLTPPGRLWRCMSLMLSLITIRYPTPSHYTPHTLYTPISIPPHIIPPHTISPTHYTPLTLYPPHTIPPHTISPTHYTPSHYTPLTLYPYTIPHSIIIANLNTLLILIGLSKSYKTHYLVL